MVNCCSVLGCSNRSNRDGKSYHSIPAIIVSQGEKTRELSEERRGKWIAKLGREKYTPTKYTKICSDHFVSGKPSTLYDVSNPDWVPSVNMGTGLSLKDAQTLSKYRKAQRAQRKKVLAAAQMLVEMSRPKNTKTDLSLENTVDTQNLVQLEYPDATGTVQLEYPNATGTVELDYPAHAQSAIELEYAEMQNTQYVDLEYEDLNDHPTYCDASTETTANAE